MIRVAFTSDPLELVLKVLIIIPIQCLDLIRIRFLGEASPIVECRPPGHWIAFDIVMHQSAFFE